MIDWETGGTGGLGDLFVVIIFETGISIFSEILRSLFIFVASAKFR